MFYLKPRVVSAVVYLQTLKGIRPVTVRIAKTVAERILASAKVRKRWLAGGRTKAVSMRLFGEGLALLVLKIPDICKVTNLKELDAVMKKAYRSYDGVKSLVDAKALEKVGGNDELAKAYIRAWLKAENLEVPGDDPDAGEVSSQYYKLIWRFGDKYVVQDPPWC